KTRRRPKRSASEPDSMSRHAITRVYASIVHCRPLTDACRAPWIDGKATLTIEVSRRAMYTLRQHVTSTTERRRAARSGRELTVAINIVVSQQPKFDESVAGRGKVSKPHPLLEGCRTSVAMNVTIQLRACPPRS